MSKFKSFKEYLRPKKCMALIKRICTLPSSSRQDARKRLADRNSNENNLSESMVSTSSAEGFIPLTARDSIFIDLSFYNPNFNDRPEDDECEEEEASDTTEREPIHSLFPDVDKELLNARTSTSEVTKLLVGQKANFGHIKTSRNVLPTEQKLTSVQEMPQEERNQSQSSTTNTPAFHQPANESAAVSPPQSRRSVSRNEASSSSDRNDSDDDPNSRERRMHLKRRTRSERNGYQPTPVLPPTPKGSYVGKVESHDSLLGTQEHRKNMSPQRQREKARMKMMRQVKGHLQQKAKKNESATTEAAADDEDNAD